MADLSRLVGGLVLAGVGSGFSCDPDFFLGDLSLVGDFWTLLGDFCLRIGALSVVFGVLDFVFVDGSGVLRRSGVFRRSFLGEVLRGDG